MKFFHRVFPTTIGQVEDNQERFLAISIDSHDEHRNVRAVWYNNSYRGRTRNESRITQFGGRSSPVLNPENTGAIVIFAFAMASEGGDCESLRCWVAESIEEERTIESVFGEVEPGIPVAPDVNLFEAAPCWLSSGEVKEHWGNTYPTGQELISEVLQRAEYPTLSMSERLMKRRACEYSMFLSIEQVIELNTIREGFTDLDSFLKKANSILNRRKSRTGKSLELHLKNVFLEEGLEEETSFSYQKTSEGKKTPDFLFPSKAHYDNPHYNSDNLRMLGVKTTLKDRWRQILNEADRIPVKHLMTLQEGVSHNQFSEIESSGLKLVVPTANLTSFHKEIRDRLIPLESFIREIQSLTT
jgi:hypothetical protein